MHPRNVRKRAAITVAVLALLTGLAAAQPAAAATPDVDPANSLGEFAISPTTGTVDTWITEASTAEGSVCPTGYTSRSGFWMFAPGTQAWVRVGGDMRAGISYPPNMGGILATDTRVFRTGEYVRGSATYDAAWFQGGGTFTLYLTCQKLVNFTPTVDKYYSATITVDAAGNYAVGGTAPVKTDTTTALAGAAHNDGTVELTATVSAATASGTVSFQDAAGTEVGNAAVANGVASWTSGVLPADTTLQYKAVYSGDTAFNASTSDTITVTTVGEPQPPQSTEVTVTIPASATGLKFTVTPGNVALSAAALQGTNYVAAGTLGEVTVSDNRATRTPWTLNGKAGAFANTADASKSIAASSLGWKPALVGDANGGTAGAEVTAGAAGGLSTDKPLAQAAAGATVADTTVKADVTLTAPADTPAGDYKATLTLTLI